MTIVDGLALRPDLTAHALGWIVPPDEVDALTWGCFVGKHD